MVLLTQLTTGGRRDAEIATPINGPAAPSNKANATPVPDVNALCVNFKNGDKHVENEYRHRHQPKRKYMKKMKKFEKLYFLCFRRHCRRCHHHH